MRQKKQVSEAEEGCCEPKKNAATRIFETAQQLFYQRGIRAVGVDEIVCTAGVTKPSLYRSFASKDDLVAACLESYAEEGKDALMVRIARAGGQPLDELRAIIGHYADEMSEPGFRGCPMSNTAVEFPEEDNPGRAIAESCKAELRELIVGITRRLDIDDPEGLGDGLLLLIEGAYSAHQIFGSQGPSHTFIKSAERLIGAYVGQGARPADLARQKTG
ncbi:TetR/AcrR family transcriptional regulator [Sphingosinicella sp. LHD-64]|uniref:TetR/AcrR family transcriptional regulator n=1 Tax=Sphingosinicella sp. LHD-64 TaxID=3072139 RepID=UPI0028102438|nr:TetR/AcrR family transcriptional regulator [Sphingosinicella sp. LHD-64]MDQ8755753.1 TetR/AcrR family transcriptional regulator [Sphingosinicella sp. LHD-64]